MKIQKMLFVIVLLSISTTGYASRVYLPAPTIVLPAPPIVVAPPPPVYVEAPPPAQVIVEVPPPIVLAQPPQLIFSPAVGAYVAVGVPYNLVVIDGMYYRHEHGRWYSSATYGGAWVSVHDSRLPGAIRTHGWDRIRQNRDREYANYRRDPQHYRGKFYDHKASERMGEKRADKRADQRADKRADKRADQRADKRTEHKAATPAQHNAPAQHKAPEQHKAPAQHNEGKHEAK